MSRPTNQQYTLLLVLFLFVVAVVFLLPRTASSRLGSEKIPATSETSTATDQSPPQNASRPARPAKFHRVGTLLDSEETWDIDLQGTPSSIKLALDQASLRDADGKDRIVTLTPAATQETLPSRLAALSSPGGVFPVAYLAGEERSTASRRLITPDLRVKLDDAKATEIARRNQLTIKDRPTYAPGWVIMTAKNAFAALDAMVDLRAIQEVASADVLLAVQHSLRALPNDPLAARQWHLNPTPISPVVAGSDVKIDSVWNYPSTTGIRGKGIRIGVVDDGLQTNHPDLVTNVDTTNDKDWNGNDADPSPGSGDDHGTSCGGNAAARGNNNLGVTGSAPEATLVGMRLIAAAVTDAQEAEAMAYLPNLIQIKSNSWGPNDSGTALEPPGPLMLAALQTAATTGRDGKGSIMVWAGGNGGNSNDNSNYDGYANSIYTIAIGATNSNGARSDYSEPGANIVVTAPSDGRGGLGIVTVDRTGTAGYNTNGSTAGDLSDLNYTNSFGGTSSATPTAAGIVALMLEKNPNLGWRDVQEILIKSATKFKPTDTGWITNGAGIPFNHDFGAGLINATAAVNLSNTWINLPAQTSTTSTQTNLTAAIPNNLASGLTRTFDLSNSNIRVEHVTLRLTATHTARGNLQITLTSPAGMISTLAAVRADTNDNYSNWTFNTVRNWGENSAGIWTLKIADLSSTGNTTGGTVTAAELKVFGSPAIPTNPAPLVQITTPTDGQVFSVGVPINVNVSASDLTVSGGSGTVSKVELFDDGISIGKDTTTPYTFNLTPAQGSHVLVAKATDSEGAVGSSVSVTITVTNQSPVISAATLSATDQHYTDTPLIVTSISATDPENQPLVYSYQWQASQNRVVYTDIAGATAQTAPALAGNLLRCVVTASDGTSSSSPFTTAAVNLLIRPNTSATLGADYTYTSDLVLNGTDSQLSRQAIIHEFSQGPSGSSSEWIEILTLKSGSLAYWDIRDASGNIIVFLDDPVWDDIPAGTLIVIYNGASRDPLLPPDDLDPTDGRMVVSSINPAYFDDTYDAWLPLGNSGDSIFLSDDLANEVHSIAYGNSTTTTPNVGSVGSGKSAYYIGDTDAGADIASNWKITTGLVSRNLKVSRTAGDLYFTEYVEGTSNNKALEIYNPTSSTVNLATAGYKIEIYNNGSVTVGNTINLTGSMNGFSTYVVKHNTATGVISTVTAQLRTALTFNGNDAVLLKKGTATVDSIGQVGVDPGTAWVSGLTTTLDKTLRRKSAVTQGDANSSDAYNPSLEWDVFDVDTISDLGKYGSGSIAPRLGLSIAPTTFSENMGTAAATGVVSIPSPLGQPLAVTLASSDTTEATVAQTVTINAGQTTSPTFMINAVDDSETDGSQNIEITATASGYTSATISLTVTDNEPSIDGVTPAAPNNPINDLFLKALRDGALNSPALFRIGSMADIPVGLTLNPSTGVLSGIIALSNTERTYLISIERFNSTGDIITQNYTLTIGAENSNTFSAWISGFPVGGQSGFSDDPDQDGVPNGVENLMGTSPNRYNSGLTQIAASSGELKFRHRRSKNKATDLTGLYEWSHDLSSWHASGETAAGSTVTIQSLIIQDTTDATSDLVEVSTNTIGINQSRLFVRIKSVKQ